MVSATVTSHEAVPAGTYRGQFGGVAETEAQFGPAWEWTFHLDIGNGATSRVTGLTSTIFSEKSKAYEWASVLLGRRPAENEVVNFDDLRGAVVGVAVSVKENGWNKIEQLGVLQQPTPAQPAAPAQVPPVQPYVAPDEAPF